jgi:DNA mismatch repair protein MutL
VAQQAMAAAHAPQPGGGFAEPAPNYLAERQASFRPVSLPSARPSPFVASPVPALEPDQSAQTEKDYPLGTAVAQLHDTYILSQTTDGFVLVDQHAAHERLVYERMKAAEEGRPPLRQTLLVPEVVELSADEAGLLLSRRGELEAYGLVVEDFGGSAVLVREVPAVLGQTDLKRLVRDIACEIENLGEDTSLKDTIAEKMGNHACANSVRAGRRLNTEEMNALLRQMEATPHSGQCNHGRPTYVELKLKDVERLFGRR